MAFSGVIATTWHLSVGGDVLYLQVQSLTQLLLKFFFFFSLTEAVDRQPVALEPEDYAEH